MNDDKIKRINELYNKMKAEGLTDAEKEEQTTLRQEYIAAVRRNLRGQLNNVSILNDDGSVTKLKDKDKTKKMN
ncbi:hypothetical protein lbkm_0969 [Lachnospiraceae bacterium KM106-2]|nr:hypothetical protein lbkm_0969 [Lachnospiraceae bacterium KM106-2]